MVKKLKKLREELPGIGTRKLQRLTVSYRKKHNIKMGRDKMHELLRREDMHIRFRRRRTRTTYSDHSYVRYKNLTENLEVTAVNQLYVSDITYIPVGKHFAYLNLVTDAYSRKIVGWKLHESLHAQGAIRALEMALQQKGNAPLPQPMIHHSDGSPRDRGIQYCCYEHIHLLKKHDILISMTNSPDPLENPLAERMNRTIKVDATRRNLNWNGAFLPLN